MRTISTILAAAAIAVAPTTLLMAPVASAVPTLDCNALKTGPGWIYQQCLNDLRIDPNMAPPPGQIAQNTPTPPPPSQDPWGHEYGPGDRHGPAGPYAPNVPVG